MSFAYGEEIPAADVLAISGVMALGHVMGYWLAIMHCLRIGPAGPTAAMNNMGLAVPVVLGAVWLQPHTISVPVAAGVAAVLLSFVCMGFAKSSPSNGITTGRTITTKWLIYAFAGWFLAGVAMTSHAAAGLRAPRSPFAITFVVWSIATCILAVLNVGDKKFFTRRRELAAGLSSGVLMCVTSISILGALRSFGPEVVFPISMGGAVVLVLLLGKVVFREHLRPAGWLACILGVIGIVLLSLG